MLHSIFVPNCLHASSDYDQRHYYFGTESPRGVPFVWQSGEDEPGGHGALAEHVLLLPWSGRKRECKKEGRISVKDHTVQEP